MANQSPTKSLVAASVIAAIAAACGDPKGPSPAPPSAPSMSAPAASAPARERIRAHVRQGASVARSVAGDVLYVADEDNRALVTMALPLTEAAKPTTMKLPGAPSAVLALDGRLLVVVRALAGEAGKAPLPKGLLLVMKVGEGGALTEDKRIELPADAWGLAVTSDERTAIVTSAWSHRVSAVDLASGAVRFSVDVGREPRGVVIKPDDKTAYVTHLVRASLSRIDGIDGASPAVKVVPFPAAPIRTRPERGDAATLGYAPVLSPSGDRLYVARQALGATGKRAWNGQATMDVMILADESSPARPPKRWFKMIAKEFLKNSFIGVDDLTVTGPGPTLDRPPFVQPRGAVYRAATHTVLVASEGTDELVELDALAIDPSIKPVLTYDIGKAPRFIRTFFGNPADRPKEPPAGETRCGGPSGVALSADEATAYVLCRTSRHVAAVPLSALDDKAAEGKERPKQVIVALGEEPLSPQAALGRRLFSNAMDTIVSGFYGCNGCHPEGRDDGHVWHEEEAEEPEGGKTVLTGTNLHAFEMSGGFAKGQKISVTTGAPRQTPMLAGRVTAQGPYGWKGRSPTLRHRAVVGFRLHRWEQDGFWRHGEETITRADALAAFAREGLVPPPREDRALTPEEERGKQLFMDANVGCAECHKPNDGEYTTRALASFGPWRFDKTRFSPELNDDYRFKTPSLRYVGGTPPYYHDGSEPTLESLLERNGTMMGRTKHLSADDKKALVAFLRTL